MIRLFFFFFFFAPSLVSSQVKSTFAEQRLQLQAQKENCLRRSVVNCIPFHSIGPSIMGGRVIDIAVNDTNTTEFFVAYATGGLWYTNNNGQSFTPVFDSAEVLSIGAIAVDWKSGAVWVGTGENLTVYEDRAGWGMYKSMDKGNTWENVGLIATQHISRVVIDPTNKNVVWVAALGNFKSPSKERGIYKTIDGGRSWKKLLYINDNTGATDLVLNPQQPDEVYAALWYNTRPATTKPVRNGTTSGIYKTTNGGTSWKLVSQMNSGFPSGDGIGRIALAFYAKHPNIIYAHVINNTIVRSDTISYETSGPYDWKMFRSLSKEDFLKLNDSILNKFFVSQGLVVFKASEMKQRIIKGEIGVSDIYNYFIDRGEEDVKIVDRSAGIELYCSHDGGLTWQKTVHGPYDIEGGWQFGKLAVSSTNSQFLVILGITYQFSYDGGVKLTTPGGETNVHTDFHACWIDPQNNGHIILGTDGGLSMTYDYGKHWNTLNQPGLSVGQFYTVAVDDAKPYNVYGGMQDNGIWWGPSDNNEISFNSFSADYRNVGRYPYQKIWINDGMDIQVDTRDNETIYCGSQFGSDYGRINKLGSEPGIRFNLRYLLGERPLRWNWKPPILISKHNQDIVFVGANRLFRSLDRGRDMKPVSPDLTKGGVKGTELGTITTITESPKKFGLLYVGTDDGNIQVSKDGGHNWKLVSPELSQQTVLGNTISKKYKSQSWIGLTISCLETSRFKEGRVYATMEGFRFDHFRPYVYVSEDYGATWKQTGKDLPYEPVNVIREDPRNENILYVGTDGGLYVSFDRGQSFMSWNMGMPKSVIVMDIAIQERENEIVLATFGRSLYVAKLDDVQGLAMDKDWMKKKPILKKPLPVVKETEEEASHEEEER